jgi:rod shape-determining protein MreC
MKMNYQPKNNLGGTLSGGNRNRRKSPLPMFIGIAVVVLLVAFLIFSPSTLNTLFLKLISPFWGIESVASEAITSKSSLVKENDELKQKLDALASSDAQVNELTQENNELKELLGRTTIHNRILTAVVKRPPFSAYDTLVIDGGSDEGVAKNDIVYALGSIPMGKVTEVAAHSAKVTLFSNPGQQYDVLIGSKDIEASAVARGGGVYEVTLPRDADVKVGDPVSIPSVYSNTFGTITTVIAVPSRAFSTVLFNSPVNVNQLRWVPVDHPAVENF